MQHGYLRSAKFSPDSKLIVTASDDKTARLWDAATGKPVGEPMRHESFVFSASFSPDGRRVVTASNDNTSRLWDAATGKPLSEPMRHAGGVIRACFSLDGRHVVTVGSDTARIWDAATGKPVGEPMQHELNVHSASFSPDSRRVVTASSENTARLWDAATGKPVGEPMQHEGNVNSASFSPDGKRVVTASEDKTARVWDATTGKPVNIGADPLACEPSITNEAQRNEDAGIHSLTPTTVNPADIEFMAGKKINQDGEAVDIPQSEITAWRLKLLAQPAAQDDAWRRLLRWKLSDPSTRAISFNSTTTAPEHIEREITWAMSHLDATKKKTSILTEAYDLDPGSPLIHLALAAVEGNEVSREFLKDYGLKQLAAAEAISDKAAHQAFTGTYRAKAAILLSLQGDQARAAQVFAALLAKHDPQRQTWGSPAWIEKLDDFEWPKPFRETLIELANSPATKASP
jgi:predicted oxidoreductase (fatty acid repression mutant protein)